jgi:hypothetical protein
VPLGGPRDFVIISHTPLGLPTTQLYQCGHRFPYPEAIIPKLTVELPPAPRRERCTAARRSRWGGMYPGMICNMDQTPMPFEFQPLKGRKDSKEVIRNVDSFIKDRILEESTELWSTWKSGPFKA